MTRTSPLSYPIIIHMAKERIIWLDNLKVFLISMVVLGHTLLFTSPEGSGNVAYRIIASFWMALFMFTSGFSSYREEVQWLVVKKRFFQLMIPFFAWSMIVCIKNGTYHIEQMFLYPTQSMWFLYALFFIVLIHVAVCKAAKIIGIKEELAVVIAIISLCVLQRLTRSKVFGTDLISYHFLFYTLGYYGRKYFNKFLSIKPIWFYMMALAFVVMAFFRDGRYLQIIHLPSSAYIVYELTCAFFAIGAFVYLFSKYFDKFLAISKIGGGTLGIYVFHLALYPVVLNLLEQVCDYVLFCSICYYIFSFILWQLMFWLSYGMVLLVSRSHLLSCILLGKTFKQSISSVG